MLLYYKKLHCKTIKRVFLSEGCYRFIEFKIDRSALKFTYCTGFKATEFIWLVVATGLLGTFEIAGTKQ